jgi:hypothetical protein
MDHGVKMFRVRFTDADAMNGESRLSSSATSTSTMTWLPYPPSPPQQKTASFRVKFHHGGIGFPCHFALQQILDGAGRKKGHSLQINILHAISASPSIADTSLRFT